jgi:SAM-dependent methyltransferase
VRRFRRFRPARDRPRPRPRSRGPREGAPNPSERFRDLDPYRANREWLRYEGTGQRELFRTLRERFLRRHQASVGWTLDVGSGPGRFTPLVGSAGTRRVAIDLSGEMLRALAPHWTTPEDLPHLALADGLASPFHDRAFTEVVVLGNAVGFAGDRALDLVDRCAALVSPGGFLLVETAPGVPTTSRYLARLPPSAMVRLLRSPPRAFLRRLEPEGFLDTELPDRTRHGFRPLGEVEVRERLGPQGFEVVESVAVAPGLGAEPERLELVRADPVAWRRLIELEELLGALAVCRRRPAALLTAAVRRTDDHERTLK